ncbi:beta-ketoacyl synthase N-terminal-like domain-containing protein [Nocardia crassostreae]|uniref:beta-ketoacyl synthase N-terminal-like domain-containing protein n=1 Tax=Nocardia crassostreae TaxID=53428 RepID=UPI000832E0D0|nr:beta-ketoacyl synthase N-terminal-like domain-containing protein [Nocardia crassostreae]
MSAIAITGWGVVSSIGIGAENFTTAWCSRTSGVRDVSGMYPDQELPVDRAAAIVDFQDRDHLGRKGTSFYDRSTAMTVVAVKLALEDAGRYRPGERDDDIGVVLGTTTGALEASWELIRDSIVSEKPYLVNPVKFPYVVMNGPASAAAIRYLLGGANVTVSGGQAALSAAMAYGRRHVLGGHGKAALVGVVDEFAPTRAWAAAKVRAGTTAGRAPLGEGAAIFLVEDADTVRAQGRTPDAEIPAVVTGLFDGAAGSPDDPVTGFAGCIERALEIAEVRVDEVSAIAPSLGGSPRRDAIESAALAKVFGDTLPTLLPVKELLGETYSASGGLQLAAVLAEHRNDRDRDGAVSLVTSITTEGLVGVAVVRGFSRATGD